MEMFIALITVGAGIGTFYATKRKELEFETRQLKINAYQNFLHAVFKRASNKDDSESELMECYYSMLTVSSGKVLIMLVKLMDSITNSNPDSDEQSKIFTEFIKLMREDIQIYQPGIICKFLSCLTKNCINCKYCADFDFPDDFLLKIYTLTK